MRSTVSLVAFLVRIRADRPFLTITDGLKPVGGYAELDQEVLRRRAAAVAETQVVFRRPALVAVSFDQHIKAWVVVQQLFEHVGISASCILLVRPDVTLV